MIVHCSFVFIIPLDVPSDAGEHIVPSFSSIIEKSEDNICST